MTPRACAPPPPARRCSPGTRAVAPSIPSSRQARTKLIAVTASFGGLALFIAIFVVAGTMGLSIQQREREIALLRAVAATPGQIRRMIAWEATIVALVGSAAGVWPGAILGRALAHALVRHGIAPPTFSVAVDGLQIAAVIGGGVAAALLAVLGAGRRAARVPPTHALAEAAVQPRLLGPGRVIGGLLALAGAVPLFAVSATTRAPDTAAATSEMTALFLVVAVGFLGPIVARGAAALLGPPLARISPVGGFLASANLRHRHAALLVGQHAPGADGRDELHPAVQHDHPGPRRQSAAARRPGGRARHHQHRPWAAGRDAGATPAPRPECARRSP